MSTNLDIKKKIEVELDIKKKIEVEIEINIDSVCCDRCGGDLEYEVTVDSWGDLDIRVAPCKCVIEDKENE
ncbi:MAG: hypothetical protein GY781_11310 [Gammaproteobacteria bacterium]|nr:hypothetical protein [Gammaproteobacteria bacterium]